ncbi:hypothetical protein ACFL0T_06085, partial [Candidatus Omnitrophota bacterium]
MNKKFIIFSVGTLLEVLAFILLVPAGIALFEIPSKTFPALLLDYRLLGFLIAIVISLIFGKFLKAIGDNRISGTGIREGFAIVTFSWLLLTLVGSIPLLVYFLSQAEVVTIPTVFHAFTDSYFEI